MSIQKKPYLIIPFLIEQPTWGGQYICRMKQWLNKPGMDKKKIGQSYELYDRSLLATTITSSDDERFSHLVSETIPVSHFAENRSFPLIKFTQAKGNSFQLHIKPKIKDKRWQQKAESWYYFEDGKITFGIKKGANIKQYKQTCLEIEGKMKLLSKMVVDKTMTEEGAIKEAHKFIQEKNPWQYVNVHEVKKDDIVDLSGGGLHHSWEEDVINYPQGNVLYEVQQDVMDPVCTIRAFDQGKMKEDGTIREIHIEDYFKYIDLDEKRNTLSITRNTDGTLFDNPFYILKLLDIFEKKDMESITSFHHIFVKKGLVQIVDNANNEIAIREGHSCFIPKGIKYTIESEGKSTILLTHLP